MIWNPMLQNMDADGKGVAKHPFPEKRTGALAGPCPEKQKAGAA